MVAALTPITSSSKTVDYFTKDGYYAKDDLEQKKESYWHGRGALEWLGLRFVKGQQRTHSPKRIAEIKTHPSAINVKIPYS